MTTNLERETESNSKPKQFWELYQENDFVDAKDNQSDWRVGFIVEKNPVTKLFKIRFDGWSAKYDQIYKFSSGKLLDFRTIVVGYTGQKKHPGIRTDWKFTLQDHLERIQKLKEYSESKQLTARQINQFFRGHNYFYIDFLMTRNYDSIEALTSVMDYFKLNIKFCIKYLKDINPEFTQYYRAQQNIEQSNTVNPNSAMACAFYEIMDTLYIISGSYQRLNSFFDNAALIKKYLNIDFEKNAKRYYQLFIVQEFIGQGGFEVLQELIEKKLQNSKCIIPFLFLKSLVSLYNGLSSQISYQEKKIWLQKLVEITRNNIDKLKDKDIKDLNKSHVTQLLESIKSLFDDSSDKKDQIQNWALQTEVRLCKLMILCPFFQKKLKGVIGLIQIADRNKMHPNADYFVKLLLNYNILESLFASDNAQIIKKSSDFCKTLFFIDIFPKKSIFTIWEMRIGKHEAALQEMYSLISVMPSRPSDQQFNIQLFEKISQVKPEQWDEDYIKMIKQYSLAAIGWAGPGQKVTCLYGFNILYHYLLLKKNQFALNSFIQLLDRLEKTDIIANFVIKCFKKIGSNDDSQIHVLIMLKMIQEQICSLKQIQKDFSSQIIKDILRNTNETEEVVEKKFQLLSEVSKIMSITVTFEQFIELWHSFRGAKGEKAFFNWVQKKKEGGKTQLNSKISTQIRKKIFDTIWSPEYDYSKMEEKQAEIFIQFFKSINVIKGNLKRLNIIIKVDNLELDSLEKIWKALQNTSMPKIVDMLADLLAEIHMNPTKMNENEKDIWIKKLVTQLSGKLQLAYKQNNVQTINRFLLVIKKIIQRDEEIYTTKQTKYSMMKDYVVLYRANKQEKLVRFNVGGFCYDFKKLVADKFKIPFKRCKLSCKGQIIRYENYFKSMVQASFSIGAPFEIEMISGEVPSIKQCINSQLELFFQLLGDARLERNVWEIVSRLPVDRQFMLKIEHSEEPWKQINDPSLYKELYMLRVMGLMGDKWWQMFAQGKGLQTLANKFDRVSTNTKIEREYLKMLLQSIDKCLSLPKCRRAVNFEELILNMFKALQGLLGSIDQEKLENKKNSVEVLITAFIFKISEKLLKQINVLSVILNKLPKVQELFQKGLIKTNSVFVRRQFMSRMIILNDCIEKEDAQILLSIILGRLFDYVRENAEPEQTQQYFEYTSSLIKSTKQEIFKKYLQQKNQSLLNVVQHGLITQKPEQTIQTANYLLIGYLQLMKELIKYSSDEFKQRMTYFVLYKCFFTHFENEAADNKCKSKESRKSAFSLLGSIMDDGKNVKGALSLLSNLHKGALWRTRKLDDWTLTPGDKLKSASGYVGLKNLGCTCYMNSFFQQIFMIPEFRQAILQCEDPYQKTESETQNVLYQVKKMFFNLAQSQRKFYTPNQFCIAFKNYQGQPTNVHEQMDIDQFSGMLFDRLQNQMKGTHYENVVKDFFGGIFSNQIICKGCPHFSQTEQSFLSVSLSVKNKKNIYQSLDTMIKGDTLDGDNAYFCERCNKKVPAVKRVCLKKLPDHLFLTLKRFQFDFQTMNKMKINDYCQFPIDLNVKQYSQQFLRRQENPDRFDEQQLLPDSYYDYVLKGVAIHLGYADSGHYYSYINQRKPNGKWFEFNDTVVRSFDVKRLPQEAFGGQVGTFEIKQKIKNAYMLIYERKVKVNDFSKYNNVKREQLFKASIYENLSEQIHRQNVFQKIENILFSEEYSLFASELLKKVNKMQGKNSVQLLKYVSLVYLTVTIRQKDEGVSFQFLKKLNAIIVDYPEVYEWIVKIFSTQKSLMEFIKNNPAKEVKKLLASWVISLARLSKPEIQTNLIDSLLVYITQNHENNTQFCYILFELMRDDKLCIYAIQKNIVGRLLENLIRRQPTNFKTIEGLYCQESAQAQIGSEIIIEKTSYEMSKKLKPLVDNPYVWGILDKVVQIAKKNDKKLDEILSDIELEYMNIPSVKIFKILEQCRGKFQMNHLSNFLAYFCEGDEKFSSEMLVYIYKGLSDFESKRYRQFFILFKKIIKIQDAHKQMRNRKGLAYVVKALKQNQKFAFDSNIIQQWIMKIVRKNRYLQKILISEKDTLEYLTILATKKIPTQEICRKNSTFLENTVNKYHGIKMLRSIKKYLQLSKEIERFYLDLAQKKIPKQSQWDSDDDLTQTTLTNGQIIGYFDQKDAIDFIEARVEDEFLNRIWISIDKSKIVTLWKDDEKLTFGNYHFEQEESSEEILYSENTTQMDQQDDLDAL